MVYRVPTAVRNTILESWETIRGLSLRRLGWTALLLTLLVISVMSNTRRGLAQGQRKDTDKASRPAERGPSGENADAGHAKMLELLRQIAETAAEEHLYLGSQTARRLRDRIASLAGDDSASGHWSKLIDRWQLYFDAGVAELHLGNERVGIENLSNAYRLLEKIRGRIRPLSVDKTVFYLGIGYMRLGETENCVARHSAESCILPIRKEGVHTLQEGSRKAIQYFSEVLKQSSFHSHYHLPSRWLLNIAYMTIGGYPQEVPPQYLIPPATFKSEVGFPRFRNIAPKLGLNTFNLSGGAVLDDFDNDGYLDVVTSEYHTSGPMHYFRNNRDGSFSDVTKEAGLTGLYGGLNLLQADYDNDGDLDLLVLRGAWVGKDGRHPNSLLRNRGDGTFTDVTFEAGLGKVHYPTQTASWADYDNDGDLDLFIGNETFGDFRVSWQLLGKPVEGASPWQLFRNRGDGTFEDVAAQAGVRGYGFAKGVVWGDYDGDRFPDLYISNLGGDNRLYRNNGDGTFTDVAERLRVTGPKGSFPVWFWDFDNDSVLDLFVSSYTGSAGHLAAYHLGLKAMFEPPSLYRGDGKGGFEEVAKQRNLSRPMLPMGSNFGDLNNDGYLDFYLGTGDPGYDSLMPNLMFLNEAGKRFVDVTMTAGFGHLQKGHSVSFADLDNDGDVDVFEQMGGAFPGDAFADALYENPGSENGWITIRLVGKKSNRSAIGSRIHIGILEDGKPRSIYRHINSGGSFGANPLRQTIGLGKATRIEALEIYWPRTDLTQVFKNIPCNQIIEIAEGEDHYTRLRLKRLPF